MLVVANSHRLAENRGMLYKSQILKRPTNELFEEADHRSTAVKLAPVRYFLLDVFGSFDLAAEAITSSDPHIGEYHLRD